MMAKQSYDLVSKPELLDGIIFLDGVSRSGKKLNCRLLTQFDGIEHFNYISGVENVCYIHFLGQIDTRNTARFIRLNTDEAIYDRIIGRRINTRISDESSVFRTPDPAEYVRRSTAPDGPAAVDGFRKSGRVQLFHTHSVLPFAGVIFEAFPDARFIHVGRNPIDITEDWLRRGWGERWTGDPLNFSVAAESDDGVVPWFAVDWAADYLEMTPSERCIRSVLTLQDMERQALAAMTPTQQSQVLQYRLEHLLVDPRAVIDRIAAFTGYGPGDSMDAFLVSERLPNPALLEARAENIKRIGKDAAGDLLQQILDAGDAYDADL